MLTYVLVNVVSGLVAEVTCYSSLKAAQEAYNIEIQYQRTNTDVMLYKGHMATGCAAVCAEVIAESYGEE